MPRHGWRAAAGQRAGLPGPLLNFLSGLANVLSPVACIALFVFGALAIIFIKDPTRWFGSRWSAATFAGTVSGALLFLVVVARVVSWRLGWGPMPGISGLERPIGRPMQPMLQQPGAVGGRLLPAPAGDRVSSSCLGLTAFGAVQGVFYGLILPPIFRRPIDRALSIRSRLRNTPDQVLPQLYNTYNRHSDANSHLAASGAQSAEEPTAASAHGRGALHAEHQS